MKVDAPWGDHQDRRLVRRNPQAGQGREAIEITGPAISTTATPARVNSPSAPTAATTCTPATRKRPSSCRRTPQSGRHHRRGAYVARIFGTLTRTWWTLCLYDGTLTEPVRCPPPFPIFWSLRQHGHCRGHDTQHSAEFPALTPRSVGPPSPESRHPGPTCWTPSGPGLSHQGLAALPDQKRDGEHLPHRPGLPLRSGQMEVCERAIASLKFMRDSYPTTTAGPSWTKGG